MNQGPRLRMISNQSRGNRSGFERGPAGLLQDPGILAQLTLQLTRRPAGVTDKSPDRVRDLVPTS